MAPVNQSWTSFENIDHESDHTKKLRTVLQTANFNYLCSRAVELRKEQEVQDQDTLTCSVDTTKSTFGACNLVLALTFSDSCQWVVRVMLLQDREDGDATSTSLLSEVFTMKLITKTTIPVSHVYGYCETTGDFGCPYLLMEALPGNVLDSQMALSIPDRRKGKFATQLVSYIHELSTIRCSRIGRVLYHSG